MSGGPGASGYAEQLRRWGCVRIRVSDRKQVGSERTKVNLAAASLGRRAYMSYRYPYLYARLGEPVAAEVSRPADVTTQLAPLTHEGGPRYRETIGAERV